MHFVDTFMTGSATDAKENHFEDKTLLYWWFSWLLQIICVLFDQYHSICIFSFLVIKTSLHTSGREFKALDWQEQQQSAGVQLCSSSQSRDFWRRCRKVVASEQMGIIYELFHVRLKKFYRCGENSPSNKLGFSSNGQWQNGKKWTRKLEFLDLSTSYK